VYELQHGRGDLELRIRVLEQQEARFGIEMLVPELPYYVSPEPELRVEAGSRFEHLRNPPPDLLAELVRGHRFPFLTVTHAVLQPALPDHSDVVFQNAYFYSATARAYAATYAEWATQVRWLGRDHWSYTDLLYVQTLSEDEYAWILALNDVVRAKCARAHAD